MMLEGQSSISARPSHPSAANRAARLLDENPDRWLWLEMRKHAGSVIWSLSQYLKHRPHARNVAVWLRVMEAAKSVIEDSFMR